MTAPDLYSDVRAYDIAFADRDFVGDCDFLEYCLTEFGSVGARTSGRLALPPRTQPPPAHPLSFLELAAGPARHAREIARRGWRSFMLDLSPDMLNYAQARAKGEGLEIEAICADMTDFDLEEPVALAATLLESLAHLTTNEQVICHLRAVSRNLLPGGIFVIQMAHPQFIW